MQKKGKIQIKLQSDLCVASGYSYDGIIDTDICYDTLGIPYIPAKRLKGCFKETAENILYSVLTDKDIEYIFGKWGANLSIGIVIGNAYIQNYEKIRGELNNLCSIENKDDLYKIDSQKILGQFTHVQAQTAIGYIDENQENKIVYDGSAKDNSFRYTRVVNQYSPIDGECLVFEADILYDALYEDKIKEILNGTRNIGLKRNRGFGSVKCSLKNITRVENTAVEEVTDCDDTVCIDYVLKNLEPLVLCDKDDQKTIDYIKGQTIIGALAAKYLEIKGNSANDVAFKDLFLNGNTIITDAMPYKNGKTYYPAPLFINQLKKTKDVVNSTFINVKNKEHRNKIKDGNLPKKLKGKYLYATPDFEMVSILEVNRQIYYHHSHNSVKNSKKKDILFAFEVISENQKFAGKIILPKKYEKMIKGLLNSGTINIGKSKSAQYGKCEIHIMNLPDNKKRKFLKGKTIAVTLQSDMLLYNGVDYTVFYDDVVEMIAKELGIIYKKDKEENANSVISTKEITGYSSVWNMRKISVPAIAAGSMLSYKLEEDLQIPKEFCGERCLEGFGNVRVDYLESKNDRFPVIDILEDKIKKNDMIVNIAKPLASKIFMHDLEMELVLKGINNDKFGLNQSKIGRVTLMLKESIDENEKNSYKAFESFKRRVASIKSDDERNIIENLVVNKIFKEINGKKILNVDTAEVSVWDMMKKVGFSEDECIELLNSLWGKYVLMILVNQKYENKNRGDV